MYFDAAYLNDIGSYRKISINDGTNSNQITIEDRPVSNQVKAFVTVGGVSAVAITTTLTDIKKFNKIAFKWKTNDFALWVNGTEIDTVSSGITSNANTLNALEFEMFNNNSPFYGKVKSVEVFTKALSDEELQKLTTI